MPFSNFNLCLEVPLPGASVAAFPGDIASAGNASILLLLARVNRDFTGNREIAVTGKTDESEGDSKKNSFITYKVYCWPVLHRSSL